MIRSSIASAALAVAGLLSTAHALKVTATQPVMTIKATIDPGIKAQMESAMNNVFKAGTDSLAANTTKSLDRFGNQKELAQGFANGNAYSVHSGTLNGYQNYDLFAVSAGLMVGVQAPSTDFGYYAKIPDDIQEKGDLFAGLAAGVSMINVGVNAGFLVPGLYVNAKYGAMGYDFGDFGFDFSVMGVGANYRIFDSKSLVGIVKWRGLSVGTGFYMQKNAIEFSFVTDSVKHEVKVREQVLANAPSGQTAAYDTALTRMGFTAANPNATFGLEPKLEMGMDITTMTVPLEASTALSLLWGMVNLSVGAGVDLNFGSSEIILKNTTGAGIKTPDSTKVSFTDASVVLDGSSDASPSFLRPRVMAGVGFGIGPVKLDIPVSWYLASGVAFGLTAGIVW